ALTRTNCPWAKPIEAVLPRKASRAVSACMSAVPIRKVGGDKIDQRRDRCLRVLAQCLDFDDAAVRSAHPHHLGNALGVDPVGCALHADRNVGLESLGKLCKFDRGTACIPTAWIRRTVPVKASPLALDVSSIFMSNPASAGAQPAESSSATALT